jgi:hypothetical protein
MSPPGVRGRKKDVWRRTSLFCNVTCLDIDICVAQVSGALQLVIVFVSVFLVIAGQGACYRLNHDP